MHEEKTKKEIFAFAKGKLLIIGLILFLIALFVVFINNKYLTENPFKDGIVWEDAAFAVAKDDGTVAVVDSMGSRVSIVNEEEKLVGSVTSSWFSREKLSTAASMAFTDNSLYVLDIASSEKGNEIASERILEYSLDGKKLRTIYTTSLDDGLLIRSVYCKDNKCYVAALDRIHYDTVAIGEINNGELIELHRYKTNGSDVCEVSYNPENDATCIVTYDGKLYVAIWDSFNEYKVPDDVHVSHAVINDYDYLVALDSSNDKLYLLYPNGKLIELADTYAGSITETVDYLTFADAIKEEVSRFDANDLSTKVFLGAKYTVKHRAAVILTYFCLLIVVAYLLLLLIRLVISIINILRGESQDEDTGMDVDKDKVTIKTTISRMMPTFLMCYAIAAFILGTVIWNTGIDNAQTDIKEMAITSMHVIQETVGDRLHEINSEKDYNSEAYKEIFQMFDYLCGKENESGLDYGWNLYKYIDGTNSVMTIQESTNNYRIGEIVSYAEQAGLELADDYEKARNGGTSSTIYQYKNGMELMWATIPVKDSSGKVVGIAFFHKNYSIVKAEIIGTIVRSLAEMLVLMAGFLILLAEIGIGKKLAKLQLGILKQGDANHTLVESSHTLQVISNVTKSISTIFITLIAADITNRSGVKGAVLIALPFTLQTVFSMVAKALLIKVKPNENKKVMTIGSMMQIAGALFGLAAVIVSGYVLLCIGASLLSMGSQICISRSFVLNKMGTKVTDTYDNIESYRLVAPPIGAAIGAACRTYFGNIAVFIILVVISIVYIIVKDLFVGDTLVVTDNIAEEVTKSSIKDIIKFVLRPKFFVWLLGILLPVITLTLMSNYVLPVMIGKFKSSDIIIAAITVIIVFITLYVLPYIKRDLAGKKSNLVYGISMLVIAGLFVVFSRVSSLECFAVIILAISIMTFSLEDCNSAMLQKEIENYSLRGISSGKIVLVISGALRSIMPTVITLVLGWGMNAFGLITASFLTIGSVVAILFFGDRKE